MRLMLLHSTLPGGAVCRAGAVPPPGTVGLGLAGPAPGSTDRTPASWPSVGDRGSSK